MSGPVLCFVLVNESTLTDTGHGGALTADVLSSIAIACQSQAMNEVANAWGVSATVRVGASDGSDVHPGEVACWIKDSLPDVPGAVGYHDKLANGCPVAYFSREDCTSLTSGAESLSVCISHEILETMGDPGANRWADVTGDGGEKALELCDQVQNLPYAGANGVMVSDFLLPAAFDPGASGPFDFLGKLSSGDDYSQGYMITRAIDQQAQSLTPKLAVKVMGSVKPTQKRRHPSSRIKRRGGSVA